jgi:hypothetical protein
MSYVDYCHSEYKKIFTHEYSVSEQPSEDEKRRFAQKKAIKDSSINAIRKFPDIEPADIWKTIYISHVNNITGIVDRSIIDNVISADNSWKKSSGHAFEEIIKEIGNLYLKEGNIRILLQKDLNFELHNNNVLNEVRDISWLREQINTSIFDLYLAIEKDQKYLVYGCIQSKTSIRDRVTRDREPSINAMKAFFLSLAIVMDGDFLRLPKFKNMVNGNSPEFQINGWHYMYVFTNQSIDEDRIKAIDISMERFINDAIKGAEFWTAQRQWLNNEWRSN